MSQWLGVYFTHTHTHTHTKAALQTVKNENSYSPLQAVKGITPAFLHMTFGAHKYLQSHSSCLTMGERTPVYIGE